MSYPVRLTPSNQEVRESDTQHQPRATIPNTVTQLASAPTPDTLIKAMQTLTISENKIPNVIHLPHNGKLNGAFAKSISESEIVIINALKLLENNRISVLQKISALATEIQFAYQAYYSDEPHLAFLFAFQICNHLPPEYRNNVWNLLSKDFLNISFKNTCAVGHALHTLTLFREKSHDYLLAFLNILSWMNDASGRANDNGTCRPTSFQKSIRMRQITPIQFCTIHLKRTDWHASLVIPLNIASSLTMIEEDFPADLMIPCLQTFELRELNPALPYISSTQLQIYNRCETIAARFLPDPNPSKMHVGFHLLFAIATAKAINPATFEKVLLQILPQLRFTCDGTDEDRLIVANIRKLFPTLLSNESFERLINTPMKDPIYNEPFQGKVPILTGWTLEHFPKCTFIKSYVKELLLQDDPAKQIIGIEIWEITLRFSFLHYFTDVMLLAGEMGEIVTKQKLNNRAVLCFITTLQRLYLDKTIPGDLFLSLFSKVYLANDEKFQEKQSESYFTLGVDIAQAVTKDCIDQDTGQSVLELVVKRLLQKNEIATSFEIFSNALKHNLIHISDEQTHALAMEICMCGLASNIRLEYADIVCKLFEFPLDKGLIITFRDHFLNHLRSLASIGHEPHVARLLTMQPHDLSTTELNEIRFLEYENLTDNNKKLEILLAVDKNSLNQQSRELLTTLAMELSDALINSGEIAQSLKVVTHLLLDKHEYLIKMVRIAPDAKILSALLSTNQISNQQKIELLESTIDLLPPLPDDLKAQIKKMHVSLHQNVHDNHSLVLSLLQTLLKIFNLVEIYQRNPNIWLEILRQLVLTKENTTFKEKIVCQLIEHKIIVSYNFPTFRAFFNALIHENETESAATLFLKFEELDTSHAYTEVERTNLYCYLKIFQEQKNHEKVLQLLRRAKKNESFSDDTDFSTHAKTFTTGLLERNEYLQWISLVQEFNTQDSGQECLSACEKAISAVLGQPYDKKCLSTIFSLLTATAHPNALLWNTFFHAVKESNQRQIKLNICSLIVNESKFPNVWTVAPDNINGALIHIVAFAKDISNFDAAYHLFTREGDHLLNLLNQDSETHTFIVEILSKMWKNDSGSQNKTELIKKIILFLPKITFHDPIQRWKLYKLLFNGCVSTKEYSFMLAGCSLISQVIYKKKFSDLLDELLPSILELLKMWPQTQPEATEQLVPTELSPTDLLNEIAQPIHSTSTGVFFEQYENLIKIKSEKIQLTALSLYKKSMLHLYKQVPDTQVNKFLKSGKLKIDALKLAFQSEHPTIIEKAFGIFYRPLFQEQLKKGNIVAYCDCIIKEIVQMPIENHALWSTCENICQLFILFAENALDLNKKVTEVHFSYFIKANTRMLKLSNDINSFTNNHYEMFCLLVELAENNKLDRTLSNENHLQPHLVMLKSGCEVIFQDSPFTSQLAINTCNEFLFLLQSIQNPSKTVCQETFTIHRNFVVNNIFLHDTCIFDKLYQHCPELVVETSGEYLQSIKYVIDNVPNKEDVLAYIRPVLKLDFINKDFNLKISVEDKLIYYKNLFCAIKYAEENDPGSPIHMLFLGKLLEIEPQTNELRHELTNLIHQATYHYINLCKLNRNSNIIKTYILPRINEKLRSLYDKLNINFKEVSDLMKEILRKK